MKIIKNICLKNYVKFYSYLLNVSKSNVIYSKQTKRFYKRKKNYEHYNKECTKKIPKNNHRIWLIINRICMYHAYLVDQMYSIVFK